jgi:hypothetical protein
MQYRRIGVFVRPAFIGFFALLLTACNGSSESSSEALRNANPLTISGSIGDGPITNATVTVVDSHGASVVAGVSDSSAGYEITVPAGTSFPITVTSSGGTDLVSGVAPDFDLKAILLDPTVTRVNVSPFSTLALAIAQCGGGVTNSQMSSAWGLLRDHLSMGMDPARVPNPTNGRIDASNVADIVLANEALGETLRRTEAALAGTTSQVDAAQVVANIGCDLADGTLDGAGGSADPRTSAAFSAASAGVMLEVIGGHLQVNGSDAMGAMDQAIQTILPGIDISVTTLSVPVSELLVQQARDALAVMMSTVPDDALLDYAAILGSTDASGARAAVNASMTVADQTTFDGLAARIAGSDETQVATLSQAARQQRTANVPVVSLGASPASVAAGGTSLLTWSSADALRCKANGSWSGRQPTEGSFTTSPLQTSQSYELSCVGLGGSTSSSATVQVEASAPTPPPVAPVTTITANPTSVAVGGSSTLTWSATNATSCTASGAWSGSKATSGTQSVGPLSASSTFSLSCTGSGGSSSANAAVMVQQPAAAPTLTLAASPLSVASGGNSTLTWSSANATSCVATGDWAGTRATSGSLQVGPLTSAKAYTLACTGEGGTVTRSVNVAIATPGAPTVTFEAAPTNVQSGSASQLTWSSTNATSCTASGAWSGSRATSGTQSTGALTANGNYALTCTGAGGSASQTVAVALLPVPTLTFTASPASIQSGSASQLTWSATNATSCTASGAWTGSRATSGTQSTGALSANANYTLTCTGAGGSVSRTAGVTLLPAPTLTFAASPTSLQSGAASQLTWSTTNATSCVASGGWSGTRTTSGTQSSGALTASRSFTLTCSGTGGSIARTASVTVTTPAPTVTLAASPTSVQSGSASQLTWSSTNATSCTASGAWSGTRATSGTVSTGALTANASFTLSCTGTGGTAAQTAAVAVTAAAPTVTLTASPTSVQSGSASQLTWSSTNATSCTASGAWTGTRATSGTLTTGALTLNASYTLSCTGAGGSASQTAAVTVSAAAPTLTLTASPTSVQSGSASQLTWSTTNATSCTASGAWTGARGTSGTQSTGALTTNSSFVLACAGPGGNVSRTASVTVTAGTPSVTLSANPVGVARNGSTTLTWAGTNVTGCAASGGWSGALAVSGSQSVGPITQDTTYSLTCSGGGGNAVAMTTVALREALLSWQAPTRNVDGTALTNLTGYKIYYGTSPRNYTQSVSVSGATTTQWTLSLAPGTYYFALAAVDATGSESSKTNEVTKTVR